jgi:hypothetical protein
MKLIKTRKEHFCYKCGLLIIKGSVAKSQKFFPSKYRGYIEKPIILYLHEHC